MNIEQYSGSKNEYLFNELLETCFFASQYSSDTIHWDVWDAQYNIRSSWLPSSNNIGLIIFWNAWILNNIRVRKMNIFLTNCLGLVFLPPSTLQTLYIEMYEVLNSIFEGENSWFLKIIIHWKFKSPKKCRLFQCFSSLWKTKFNFVQKWCCWHCGQHYLWTKLHFVFHRLEKSWFDCSLFSWQ